jgi:putative flippase GtrA
MIGQMIRFGGIGAMATVAHVLTALAAQGFLHLPAQGANLVGFAVAVIVSYTGHARVTFDAPLRSGSQVQRFVMLSLAGLAASSLTVHLVTTVLGLGFLTAMTAVAVIVPLATYLAMRFWVFRHAATERSLSWQGVAISAAVTLAMTILFRGQQLTNDVLWYLIATRDWIEGTALYVTIMEVNPPLNFYLTVPAILTADLFGISDVDGQYLVIWVLLFVVLSWCSAIIRADFGLSPLRQALLLPALALAMVMPALDNLGQREFFLVVLMMPWLLLQVPARAMTQRQEAVSAAVAAVGMCLKPHFVLIPLAVTLARCLSTRSLRPVLSVSNLTFLAIGAAYVGFVAVVHPAYLAEIVPIAGLVYGSYSIDPRFVVGIALHEAVFLLLPVLMGLTARDARYVPSPFPAACVAGLLFYLAQMKGFNYHLVPFVSFGMVACLLILAKSQRISPFSVAAGVTAVGLMGVSISDGFPHNRAADQIVHISHAAGGIDSLMVLTTLLSAGPPAALEAEAEWISRYPTNWLVPGALNRLAKTDCATERDTCARLAAIAEQNRSDNIADMVAVMPDLLVVDHDPRYFEAPAFDWLGFMAKDPAWADIFDEYTLFATSERFDYYLHQP